MTYSSPWSRQAQATSPALMLDSRCPKLAPLSLILALGCGGSQSATLPDPPEGFGFAFATPDCAPWDGPAISILLTGSRSDSVDGVSRQLRVAVYKQSDSVVGRRFHWPADPEVASGTLCQGSESCEAAASGEIFFRPTGSDTILEGIVLLRFPKSDSLYGGFRAAWRPRRAMCG
jgi:hypothetical protein